VRARADRPAPRRGPLARRGDSATPASARRAVHDNHPGAPERGRSRAWRRPDPPAFGCQPRLGRERFDRRSCRAAGPPGRCSSARRLPRPRGRGRLSDLKDRFGIEPDRSGIRGALPGRRGTQAAARRNRSNRDTSPCGSGRSAGRRGSSLHGGRRSTIVIALPRTACSIRMSDRASAGTRSSQ